MTIADQSAEQTARDVHGSAAVEVLARCGLAARGLVWLVIGVLGLSVLLGRDEDTDRDGALRAIADRPFGEVLLVVVACAFAGYALWRALGAAVGHRDCDGLKQVGKRALSGGKALLYGFLSWSTFRFLGHQEREGDRTSSMTADVLREDGGRWLVGLTGTVVVVVGGVLVVRAVMKKHAKKLEGWRVPSWLPVVTIGTLGLAGRGLVLALLGGFLVRAAVLFDAREAKGLDAALATLAQQPFGAALLALAVASLLAYAVWSFVEAAFRRTDA